MSLQFPAGFRAALVSALVGVIAVTAGHAQSINDARSSAARAAPSAPGSEALTGFGASIAVGGDEIFVGRPATSRFLPLNADRAGGIHIFHPDGSGGWTETGQLAASDEMVGDHFGAVASLGGGTLAVTAPEANGGEGAVYLFRREDGAWHQVARLVATAPSDSTPAEAFGAALAVHDGVVLVGAPRQNKAAGAVYVFQRDGAGSWHQQAVIVPGDGMAKDRFGSAIGYAGQDALIASPRADRRRGRVYVFRPDDAGAWAEAGTLSSGVDKPVRFGTALAMAGAMAAIAPGTRANQNGLPLFVRDDAGSWTESGSLLPDSTATSGFGRSVALGAADAWVGEPAYEGHGRIVHFVRGDDGAWSEAGAEAPEELGPNAFFGGTLALAGDLLVAAAPGMDIGQGTGFVYRRGEDGSWTAEGSIVDKVPFMDRISGAEVKCTDGKAGPFDCSKVDVLAFMPLNDLGAKRGVFVNDMWGWTDPETGHEYALVGRVDATIFLDVTDPENPVYVGELPMTEGAHANFWRDIKVYHDHAFIVADGAGAHGMQVFDLRQLRGVTGPLPVTFEETAHYDGIASAHNIVIDEETGYAYATGANSGGETCGGALHMINIQDPEHPAFAGCFADTNAGRRGTGYTHDAQCVLYNGPDTEHQGHEICFGSSETALTIADVTDKDNPVSLATASYPNVGYAHQGWLTDDQRHFYLDDELDELSQDLAGTRTIIWDVTDLDDPVMVKEHFGTTKASDHNLYIRGNFMYQSDYVSGLRILDISDPENPVEVAYLDTVPFGDNTPGFGGSWSNYPYFESGTIVVTSSREGVFLLRKQPTDLTP